MSTQNCVQSFENYVLQTLMSNIYINFSMTYSNGCWYFHMYDHNGDNLGKYDIKYDSHYIGFLAQNCMNLVGENSELKF